MAVLIGRGLDLKSNFGKALKVCFPLIFPSFLYSVFRALFQSLPFAPLAQLVEHLTLNQGVPGSSKINFKETAYAVSFLLCIQIDKRPLSYRRSAPVMC